MRKIHITSHKDGDYLSVVQTPWWTDIYESLITRLCPCCSWRGYLYEHIPEKLATFWYLSHNKLYNPIFKNQKELYKVAIPLACVASEAIYGKDFCFKDDCEHHVNTDDAFAWKEGDTVL